MVQVGVAFPFWVRQQTMLQMKVSTALPASLVRLAAGAEVAVAPRPRRTLAQQNALQASHAQMASAADADTVAAALSDTPEQPDICLRLQVRLLRIYILLCHCCWHDIVTQH